MLAEPDYNNILSFANEVTDSMESFFRNAQSIEYATDITSFATPLLSEFFIAFEASLDTRLWNKLVNEEVAEVEEASKLVEEIEAADASDYRLIDAQVALLKEIADLFYVTTGAMLVAPEDPSQLIPEREREDILDTIKKSMGLMAGCILYFSPDVICEALTRVHASNMSKLDDAGKPVRREDGKILKGPNYKEPVLVDLVELRNDAYTIVVEEAGDE